MDVLGSFKGMMKNSDGARKQGKPFDNSNDSMEINDSINRTEVEEEIFEDAKCLGQENNLDLNGHNTEENDFDHDKWFFKGEMDNIIERAIELGKSKFLVVIKPVKGSFIPRHKPFQLQQEMVTILLGDPKVDIYHTRQGILHVYVEREDSIRRLLKIKLLLGIQVTVNLNMDHFTRCFVIHGFDESIPMGRLANNLRKGNLLPVKVIRLFRSINGQRLSSGAILIQAVLVEVPEYIKLGYTMIETTLFRERPKQCVNCGHFNHPVFYCPLTKKCFQCGQNHHEQQCTAKVLSCANCGDQHETTSKNCPFYIKEIQILQMKELHQITTSEARRLCKKTAKNSTYATAVAKTGDLTKKSFQLLMEERFVQMEQKFERLIMQSLDVITSQILEATMNNNRMIIGEIFKTLGFGSERSSGMGSLAETDMQTEVMTGVLDQGCNNTFNNKQKSPKKSPRKKKTKFAESLLKVNESVGKEPSAHNQENKNCPWKEAQTSKNWKPGEH